MTLLSLCIKLYMLNVLQYSKFRPFCIARNQTFPFITRPTASSTSITNITSTISTLTTAATTATTASTLTTTPSTITTTANAGGVTTTNAGGVTTASPGGVTTASAATGSTLTPVVTTTTAGVTNPPVTNGPTTTVPTTIINTRIQRNRKSQKLTVKRGYDYSDPNCPKPIEDCPSNGSNSKCPCFDKKISKISNQSGQSGIKGRSCIGPESDMGICTTIKNCTLIVEEYYAILRKRPKISYEEFLSRSKCRETADQICCPIRK